MNWLHIDCSSGASADMLLSGFFSLGLPRGDLVRWIRLLGLFRVRIRVKRIGREGVWAVRTMIQESSPPRWKGSPSGLPRTAGRLIERVSLSKAPSWLKESVIRGITALAHAEGSVHHFRWDKTVFHQLAKADTLIALAGFSMGLRRFRIDRVTCSPIALGRLHQDPQGRWVRQVGPATLRLLRRFPIFKRPERFEWTTPTAAAILSAFADPSPPPAFLVRRIGYAVGSHAVPRSSGILRLLLGETKGSGRIWDQ